MKNFTNNAALNIAQPAPNDPRPRNAFGVLEGFGKAYAAHYALEDRRKGATFSGHFEGVRFDCSPHRYGKGMVLHLENDVRDIYKNRAAWLAEALGGKWARGHQEGYRIAPTRALQWRAFYLAGWDASVSLFDSKGQAPRFHPPGPRQDFTLKEALKQVEHPTAIERPNLETGE